MYKVALSTFLCLLFPVFLLSSCTKSSQADQEAKDVSSMLPEITTFTVERHPISPQIRCTGQIEPQIGKAVTIAPRFAGRVTSVSVTPGQHVNRGQVLAHIDSQEIGELQAELIEAISKQEIAQAHEARERICYEEELIRPRALIDAQTNLEQAKVALELAESNFERVSLLHKEKIASAKDLVAISAEAARAKSEKAQAEATYNREKKLFANKAGIRKDLQLAQAETERSRKHVLTVKQRLRMLGVPDETVESLCRSKEILSTLPVVSPLTGVIAEQHLSPGEFAEAGAKLFYICDLTTVSITSEVPEAELSNLRKGLSIQASVNTYPHEKFAGTISYIGSQVDQNTRTVEVRVLVPNPAGKLKLNMFANVLIEGESRMALSCPRSALHDDDGQAVVFVAKNSGYEKRVIKTGIECGDNLEVVNGLQPGDKVVTTGGVLVKTQLSLNKPSP